MGRTPGADGPAVDLRIGAGVPARLRPLVETVGRAVFQAADPGLALERAWDEELIPDGPVTLLAVGKASVAMARVGLERLADRVRGGCVVCPREHEARARALVAGTPLDVYGADHPLPTERNVRAGAGVAALARGAPGPVVVLLSGGGSAYLTGPAAGIELGGLSALTDALLRSGAAIAELNAVRKHLETLKGGRLAVLVAGGAGQDGRPRELASFVLSDVLGDPLDAIASGPTAADPTTFGEALDVVETRGVGGVCPAATERLRRGARGEIEETPKPGDARLERVVNRVIANNAGAARAAADALGSMGHAVRGSGHGPELMKQGEAAEVGRELARSVLGAQGEGKAAVVLGGETTVSVGDAGGVGGRNQELALAGAVELGKLDGGARCAVVSIATDGIDGPTDAAGAACDGGLIARARAAGVDLEGALSRHDSHTALDRLGVLLRTGPSGTNVNDVMVGVRDWG